MKRLLALSALTLTSLVAACGGPAGSELDRSEDDEVWSAAGNPAIFGTGLEYRLANLPAKGEAKVIPWAGSYWPTASDDINYRWAGVNSDSAAAKYGNAFGVAGVEDAVSANHGIDSMTWSKSCTQDAECDSAKGEACAKRTGKTQGRCIPTWFGICHGWTPAAILMPEPRHAVTKNGVTFQVNDLKALASLAHDRTNSNFVSLRCELGRTNGMEFDKYGRPVDESCRDSNAGTYHILLSNYLGMRGQAFAEDRTVDSEVWNQPLRGYRVTQQTTVTAQAANRLIGVPAEGGSTTQKSGTLAKGAWLQLPTVTAAAGQSYSVKMTGTGDADLYVAFRAPASAGNHACRPYASGSVEECSGVVPAGASHIYVSVNGYADSSNFSITTSSGGQVPVTYVFNALAKTLVYVKAEVDYIGESAPETDGYLTPTINAYTRTDRYEYVLELDAAGRINGGEWVGPSKQAHPDFLWLPTSVGGSTVAGGKIAYADVKALVDASVQ